jgi:alginate O-acetyltransferase complex protein AlgJ
MSIKPEKLMLVPVAAFVLLLLAGLAVSVISLQAVSPDEWRELKDPQKILSGESTKRFTKLLNAHFALGTTFNQIERGLQWNFTGDYGPSVRSGCPDWLYLADELEVHADRAKSAQFRAELATRLNADLAARGIKLLMVVVPDKTRIESAHLCGLHRSPLFAQRVTNWQASLKGRGIATLDLTATLVNTPGERYYRSDTHWNETGAYSSAKTVATTLAGLGWAAASPSGEVALNPVRIARSGDLIHLAGLDGLPAFLRPPVELAQVTVVSPVEVVSDDLFGDSGTPGVALIGTSYSRNSNFVPFLAHRLGEPVANLAKDGGDFAGAATAYFSGATYRDTPPKLVIWEIPERVIEMPVKDIERKWFDTLGKSGYKK